MSMVSACILIKVIPAKGKSVLEELKKMDGVTSAFMVFGRYDVAVFVETENYKSIAELAKKVNALKGIRRSETIVEG